MKPFQWAAEAALFQSLWAALVRTRLMASEREVRAFMPFIFMDCSFHPLASSPNIIGFKPAYIFYVM